MDKLEKYHKKRSFNKTSEPKGKVNRKKNKNNIFVVQHHASRKDHYDFRLEYKGVLVSWAVPKGPSFNPQDKRLAVKVEDHPLEYKDFEGVIPKGEYGGGTVMLFDEGEYEPLNDFKKGLKKGMIKFILNGKRLKGKWALIRIKESEDNWLLIKEKDSYIKNEPYIDKYTKSVRSNLSMKQIEQNAKKEVIEKITITHPERIVYPKQKITKEDVANYYKKVGKRMYKYIGNRLLSVIRCNKGIHGECFFKKHPLKEKNGIKIKKVNKGINKSEEYFYISDINGIIYEVQLGTIEFHTWGCLENKINHPDVMVFDLDPDEKLDLKKVRQGAKDLKLILDELNLKSFLKVSGGKGYHIVVPFNNTNNWESFREFSRNVARLMAVRWPERYTANSRKDKREGKIFIDWMRNSKGATSVAPYSLRARDKASVSMPIKWSELDKISPDEITMDKAIKMLKRKDPWEGFFEVNQSLN